VDVGVSYMHGQKEASRKARTSSHQKVVRGCTREL
jgi:hypothetical protein